MVTNSTHSESEVNDRAEAVHTVICEKPIDHEPSGHNIEHSLQNLASLDIHPETAVSSDAERNYSLEQSCEADNTELHITAASNRSPSSFQENELYHDEGAMEIMYLESGSIVNEPT